MKDQITPPPDCTAVREAISAALDGEAAPLSALDLADHVATCASCASFERSLAGVHRHIRVAVAETVPDLTGTIVAAVDDRTRSGVQRDRRTVRDLRVVVGLAGVAQLIIGGALLLGLAGPDLHLVRDLAALELALGVGLLVAALRPARAPGVLPVVAVVALAAVLTATVDVLTGRATLVAELPHLAELVGVGALWMLTRRLPGGSAPATPTPPPTALPAQ